MMDPFSQMLLSLLRHKLIENGIIGDALEDALRHFERATSDEIQDAIARFERRPISRESPLVIREPSSTTPPSHTHPSRDRGKRVAEVESSQRRRKILCSRRPPIVGESSHAPLEQEPSPHPVPSAHPTPSLAIGSVSGQTENPHMSSSTQRLGQHLTIVHGTGAIEHDAAGRAFRRRLEELCFLFLSSIEKRWSDQPVTKKKQVLAQLTSEFGGGWSERIVRKEMASIIRHRRDNARRSARKDSSHAGRHLDVPKPSWRIIVDGVRAGEEFPVQKKAVAERVRRNIKVRLGKGGKKGLIRRFTENYGRAPSSEEIAYATQHSYKGLVDHLREQGIHAQGDSEMAGSQHGATSEEQHQDPQEQQEQQYSPLQEHGQRSTGSRTSQHQPQSTLRSGSHESGRASEIPRRQHTAHTSSRSHASVEEQQQIGESSSSDSESDHDA